MWVHDKAILCLCSGIWRFVYANPELPGPENRRLQLASHPHILYFYRELFFASPVSSFHSDSIPFWRFLFGNFSIPLQAFCYQTEYKYNLTLFIQVSSYFTTQQQKIIKTFSHFKFPIVIPHPTYNVIFKLTLFIAVSESPKCTYESQRLANNIYDLEVPFFRQNKINFRVSEERSQSSVCRFITSITIYSANVPENK